MVALAIVPVIDLDEMIALYRDPYIQRIGHDDRPAQPIDHPAVKYFGAYADGDLVGAFMAIESGYVEIDVHALLLKPALPYSRELGQMFVSNMFKNDEIERLTAYVTTELQKVVNYCKRLGFKYEGTKRNACRQGGNLLDLHILGMTRNDWKESQWVS